MGFRACLGCLGVVVLLAGCSSSSSSPASPAGAAGGAGAGGSGGAGGAPGAGCPATGNCISFPAGTNSDKIQEALSALKDGDTVVFGAGTFSFTNTLTIQANGVAVLGAGIDMTILDFSGQVPGAETEGIFAQAQMNLRFEGFTVKDTAGNAVKILGSTGVTLRSIKTLWTGSDASKHGSYGLYPVSCTNVLIDKCVATGASDAGVYVGQSMNVVLQNNEAHDNVAGIEIENTYGADVHDNNAHDNTGGILVFDLPGLPQLGGHNVRVYNNVSKNNNTKNFAPKGNIVGLVPKGTGFFVMANHDVEVFGNTFDGNVTGNGAVISYLVAQAVNKDPMTDPKYYPYPRNIYIHDNTFINGGTQPDISSTVGALLLTGLSAFPGGMVVPDVLYDGVVDPMVMGPAGNPMQICLKNNMASGFADLHLDKLDSMNSNLAMIITTDQTPFNCELPALPPITLPAGM